LDPAESRSLKPEAQRRGPIISCKDWPRMKCSGTKHRTHHLQTSRTAKHSAPPPGCTTCASKGRGPSAPACALTSLSHLTPTEVATRAEPDAFMGETVTVE
jgi:hypothetical protein